MPRSAQSLVSSQRSAGPASPGRARKTQAERSEASRRRILDAAFELLVERGSLHFTLAEVGERAGYSRGLPTQVFGSKDGLIQELVLHLNAIGAETPTADPRGEGLHAVLTTLSGIFEAPEMQKKISISLQILLGEAMQPDSTIRPAVAALSRIASGYISKHFRIAVAAGEARDDFDARAYAILVMSAVHGALRQWLVDPERIAISKLRDEMLTMVLRAVAVDPEAWMARWIGRPAPPP